MTALITDVYAELGDVDTRASKDAGTSDLLYADDTLIISSDAKKANKILAAIVKHSERYGLKLNKGKCEVIAPHTKANEKIAFPTGEELKKVEAATYLGGQLRKDGAAKPGATLSCAVADVPSRLHAPARPVRPQR